MAWAPKYGLKGMIDASIRVETESNIDETDEMIVPLEFKTGKIANGQASISSLQKFMSQGFKMIKNLKICKRLCKLLNLHDTIMLFFCSLILQSSMEHCAQVILYTLLMSERCECCQHY